MLPQIGAGATREEAFQHGRNVMQLQRFVREAIEERRLKPGTDLISLLVHARGDDPSTPPLTDRELMSISTTAIAGGVDTTRNGIAFGPDSALYVAETNKVLRLDPWNDPSTAQQIITCSSRYTRLSHLLRPFGVVETSRCA